VYSRPRDKASQCRRFDASADFGGRHLPDSRVVLVLLDSVGASGFRDFAAYLHETPGPDPGAARSSGGE
jgi:hypothetical protein